MKMSDQSIGPRDARTFSPGRISREAPMASVISSCQLARSRSPYWALRPRNEIRPANQPSPRITPRTLSPATSWSVTSWVITEMVCW